MMYVFIANLEDTLPSGISTRLQIYGSSVAAVTKLSLKTTFVVGKKMTSRFLLGHSARIASIVGLKQACIYP